MLKKINSFNAEEVSQALKNRIAEIEIEEIKEANRQNFRDTLRYISSIEYEFRHLVENRLSYPINDGSTFRKQTIITQLVLNTGAIGLCEELKTLIICGQCGKLDRKNGTTESEKYTNDCSCFQEFYDNPNYPIFYDSDSDSNYSN